MHLALSFLITSEQIIHSLQAFALLQIYLDIYMLLIFDSLNFEVYHHFKNTRMTIKFGQPTIKKIIAGQSELLSSRNKQIQPTKRFRRTFIRKFRLSVALLLK